MAAKKTVLHNGDVDHRRQEVQQAVKNAADQLRSEGINPRDYVEQLSWLFFLKAFDEAESRREEEAAFEDKPYQRRLDGDFRWSSWSQKVERPDEMLTFVNGELWTKLQNLGEDPLAERFRRIFSTIRNHCRRGATFARVVQQVNRLHFSDDTDIIVLSELYENLLKQVAADSAGYAGDFYTQRHIIRAMVEVVQPKLGDRIYDPCFGTAGFLGESAEYIRRTTLTMRSSDVRKLHNSTFFGVEINPLTYLLGTMNMLLHRVEGGNLELSNTLEIHQTNVPEKNKYDAILANPPYGGRMAAELQSNFTIRSGSTEILFLQHIMTNLAKGGHAAVIIPDGILFRGGADLRVRRRLLEEFDVHTVLSLPAGCFLPYTNVKASVLFFRRPKDGTTTQDIWFYELKNDGFELKTSRKPIEGEQITDFLAKWERRVAGDNSWRVPLEALAKQDWYLCARNPNHSAVSQLLPPDSLINSILDREQQIVALIEEVKDCLDNTKTRAKTFSPVRLSDVAEINPRRPRTLSDVSDRLDVTFVPMAAVDDRSGTIITREVRPFAEVRKGFTYFANDDVIFAKITPCMQNGKTAIATDLSNGLGFGSTEFHVIRPNQQEILPKWIWYFCRQLSFRTEAQRHFRGSAGQQRVPASFLENAQIPKPSVDEQKRIIAKIDEIFSRIEDIQKLRDEPLSREGEIEALMQSILYMAFAGKL